METDMNFAETHNGPQETEFLDIKTEPVPIVEAESFLAFEMELPSDDEDQPLSDIKQEPTSDEQVPKVSLKEERDESPDESVVLQATKKQRRRRPRKDDLEYRYKGKSAMTERATPFCALCVCECTTGQVVRFSAREARRNCLNAGEGQQKLKSVLNITLDLAKDVVCRTCWSMVELLADFSACCRKAAAWTERFAFGLEPDENNKASLCSWSSETTTEMIEQTSAIIQSHIYRIETDELAARDAHDRDMAEMKKASSRRNRKRSKPSSKGSTADAVNPAAAEECDIGGGVPEAEISILTVFTCPKCNRAFDSKQGRSVHEVVCNGPDSSTRLTKCTICSAEFNPHGMKMHLNKHKGYRPFKCRKNCTKGFYTCTLRTNHERSCGGEKPICSLCGSSFASFATLAVHEETVHVEATLPCGICKLKFRTKKHLKRHMAVHSETRDYPCTECGKAFKNAYTLKVHTRIHTQEKPYSCSICGQGFAYKCLVQPHVQRAHAGAGE